MIRTIRYVPAFIAGHRYGHCVYYGKQPSDYLPLYEHLARRVLDWKLPHEVLEDTSATHCHEFPAFADQEQVETTLARLFLNVGMSGVHGDFLRQLGIRRWNDLAKPIPVRARPCKPWLMPHDVRERKLREPGPNPVLPQAVYGQSCDFRFGWGPRECYRWYCTLHYGYSRDGSTWSIELDQGGQALCTFIEKSVPAWLDTVLEPEESPIWRQQKNRDFDRFKVAVDTIFTEDWCSVKPDTEALVALLLDSGRPGRLPLTRRRLATIRRWMRQDAAKEAARVAKLKGGSDA